MCIGLCVSGTSSVNEWSCVIKEFVENCKCALLFCPSTSPQATFSWICFYLPLTLTAGWKGGRERTSVKTFGSWFQLCYKLTKLILINPVNLSGLWFPHLKNQWWSEFLSTLTLSPPTVETFMEAIVLLFFLVDFEASVLQRGSLQPKWPFKQIKFLIISTW